MEKLPESVTNKFPVWDNELVMTSHGAGSYTSRTMSKRLNAQNENLADTTEKACESCVLHNGRKCIAEAEAVGQKDILAFFSEFFFKVAVSEKNISE